MCPISSKTLKDRQQGTPSRAFPWEHHPAVSEDTLPFEESTAPRTFILPRNPLSWGRSAFREHRHSKINPSCPEQDDHSNRPHEYPPTFIESVTPPGHLIFQILQLLFQAQTVTEGSKNNSHNQEYNTCCYKRITAYRSCGYWNPHDTHCQWRLRGYTYTGRSTKRKGQDFPQKADTINTSPQESATRKRRDHTLKRSLPMKTSRVYIHWEIDEEKRPGLPTKGRYH